MYIKLKKMPRRNIVARHSEAPSLAGFHEASLLKPILYRGFTKPLVKTAFTKPP